MSFLFHMHLEHIRVTRRSHSNGAFSTILDFSIDFFAYWRSIREEVYSVIDCLHVTGFIQYIFGILVRGEINSSISPRQLLNGIPIKENWLYSSLFRLGQKSGITIGLNQSRGDRTGGYVRSVSFMYGILCRRLWDEKNKMANIGHVAMESFGDQFVLRL